MLSKLGLWIKSGRWLSWLLIFVVAGATAAWVIKLERLPQTIRLAAGSPNGQYHIVGSEIASLLQGRTGRKVEVVTTSGAVENAKLLQAGLVNLALLQSGCADMQGISSIAPLYPEPIHVVSRKSAGLTSLEELLHYRTAIGPQGSGMYEDAMRIIRHVDVESPELVQTEDWLTTLMQDTSVIGAVITTGMLHPGFRDLMATGEFELLPILDAGALAVKYPYLKPFNIPRGMYAGYPPEPPDPVETVTATSFIGVRTSARITLVEAILQSIYEDRPIDSQPAFIPSSDIYAWPTLNHHALVELYHDPIKDIGKLGSFASSISAIKELLLAAAAGIFLLYRRFRAKQKQNEQLQLDQQQAVLNQLMEKVIAIESAQLETQDAIQLKKHIEDVTSIKLSALRDPALRELQLRNEFSVFMMQCTSLVSRIDSKLTLLGLK